MTDVIRFDHVTRKFGQQIALDDASFSVPRGVVFALLGENGAGKTTAIRLMLGLLAADAGRVDVLGLDSRSHGLEIRRRVGYVAERPTLYDWMTVGEIGWFAAGFYPAGFEERYRKLAGEFGLPNDRKLKALSKGMRAKVALSLAMAHDPELLILDEPTSGLDTLVRREFLESMVDLAATGRTVLLSSHQISEVERVADYVAIVRGGRLLVVERLEDLKAEVRDVTLTLTESEVAPNFAELPFRPGTVVSDERRCRQWQFTVRGHLNGELDRLRAQPFVADVNVREPGLEEIFVAYLRAGKHASTAREEARA